MRLENMAISGRSFGAEFDFDVYAPTKVCRDAIKHRLVKASILGFDELSDPDSPGEAVALMEAPSA